MNIAQINLINKKQAGLLPEVQITSDQKKEKQRIVAQQLKLTRILNCKSFVRTMIRSNSQKSEPWAMRRRA